MKEQLINFQTAKLAKEKDFPHINKGLNNMYTSDEKLYNSVGPTFDEQNSFQAPTQSLLQKWLREKHNIHIKIDDFLDYNNTIDWDFEIVFIGTDIDNEGNYTPLISYDVNRSFLTYEQALEKGLEEALKLI